MDPSWYAIFIFGGAALLVGLGGLIVRKMGW